MVSQTEMNGKYSKREKKSKSSLLMLIISLGVLVSCFSMIVSGAEDNSGTKMVLDQRGEMVTIPEHVERVITIPIPAASMVYTLDGDGSRLVGMNPSSMAAIKNGILGKMDPDLLTIETNFIQGGMFEPNVEEILKLDPDVVFQWAQYGEELYKPLEDAGIPVICLKYGTQEDLETWIKLFGEVLDRQEQADNLITYQQGMSAKIKEKTANIAETDKPRVLSLPYGDQLTVSGSGTYNDYYFGLTGAKNVASEVPGSSTQVSMEQIINWDPEIIYIGNFDDLTPQDILENRIDGQDWAGIDAVKNGRVYKVPLGGYRWDPPNQESPLMWEWLMEIQHPELFDFNLREDMKKFYKVYYDYDLNDEEIEEILFTNLNNAIV
ncbi:ABC transporter substrate-binding protein [Methanospirillum stamsii]|uniref:Fe/B12 periplasmic-binding domain-containing protein n=1 Tax=Methanospirillum stamsii TaxID=1277351 RepID=A0A2V2NDP9_9EURY|nr:ABC transporter substrate-binding protein [Methanospirillum stamsii]PWR74548.1 hypothetical protein DLD82_08870 [Methanospirillum stamsii]